MSEEQIKCESWKDIIIDFFEHKVSKSKLFKARDYIDKKEKELSKEKDEKKKERLLKAKQKKQIELEKLRKTSPKDEIPDWLELTSKKPIEINKRIIKATHVLKFSHGASVSDGFLLTEKSNDSLLTTSSIKKPITYDLAHNNGPLITISRFLALKQNETMIHDLILKKDFSFFNAFYKNQKQLESWKLGFSNLIEIREINNADKAKQLYFPVNNEDKIKCDDNSNYHIIVPLFASSLSEEIYTRFIKLKFGDTQKEIEKQIKKEKGQSSKFHIKESVQYPNIGIINFGGAQPQNISMLNKNRGGNGYLLNTQPPNWQSQIKPPIHKKSFFNNFYPVTIKDDIAYLSEFILRNERIELSIKDPEKEKWIKKWVNNIIDEVFYYISTMQNLPAGWSQAKGVKLKQAHKFLLDPYFDDETFQTLRKDKQWQKKLCQDFAAWLNLLLKNKNKKFTSQRLHTRLWSKLFAEPLREDVEEITWELKNTEKKS